MDRTRSLLVVLSLAAGAAAHSPLFARDYVDTVCKPLTTKPGDTVPPCVEIETIETLCEPNGTAPIYLAAHQQCMCGGSYFAEWPACQACLFLHGLRSEREVAQYDGVLSAASSSFCGAATPTATFADVFSQVQATFPVPSTGATVSSDRAPSQTAVSLYYTVSGSQGPGAITGSATSATATGPRSVPPVTTPSGTTGGSKSQTAGASNGGAAGPGTKATTGPSGSGSGTASPSPSHNAAAGLRGSAAAGLVVMGVAVAVGGVAL